MKRIIAFIMALAMVLPLAACGGNADQPSSANTPPVTQEETPQPDSTPTDNAQPSEPDNTTPDEPQNDSDDIPDWAIPLYDGEHYLIPMENEQLCYTLISGEKIAKDTIEIVVESTERTTKSEPGQATVVFGDNTMQVPEQIMLSEEVPYYATWLAKNLAPGSEAPVYDLSPDYNAKILVANFSDTDKTVSECSATCVKVNAYSIDYHITTQIDGQVIYSIDDLINVLGAPTAAYAMPEGAFEGEFVGYMATIVYVWQFNDFYLAATDTDALLEPTFPMEFVHNDMTIICFQPRDEFVNMIATKGGYIDFESFNLSDTLEALTSLGLL